MNLNSFTPKFFFVFFLAFAQILFVQVVQAATLVEREAFYQKCLDDFLLHCNKKCSLEVSQSHELKKSADLAKREISFIKTHRKELISELLENKMDLKQYKIDYFVKHEFFKTISN
jgi:hypothetical protein